MSHYYKFKISKNYGFKKALKTFRRDNIRFKTNAERKLSYVLTYKNVSFLEQVILNRFIVDFYLPDRKLIIEVDGPIHNNQKDYDNQRDLYFRSNGFNVLRFANEQILSNPYICLNEILKYPANKENAETSQVIYSKINIKVEKNKNKLSFRVVKRINELTYQIDRYGKN